MIITVSNISFDQKTMRVPQNIDSIKSWLDDYKIEHDGSDDNALKTYIRTALFQCDFKYDIELAERTEFIARVQQILCIDAYDEKHERYSTVSLQLTVPEIFVIAVHQDDLDMYDDMSGQELYEQIAYDVMMHNLPLGISYSYIKTSR